MKATILFRPLCLTFVLGTIWLVPLPRTQADVAASAPSFTSISMSNGMVSLAWSGGNPMYQLQSCSGFSQAWTNISGPTNVTSLDIPMSSGSAFFRVISDYTNASSVYTNVPPPDPDPTARYYVTFTSTWSQATHPSNWPANARLSGLVGGVHNSSVHFFRPGETASEGIRLMAEQGQKTTLLSEVATAITNGTADFQLNGGSIVSSPGTAVHTFVQPMRRNFPLVTLVSMIAPSPDWFVGVDSLSLIENGQWVTNKTVTLYGMDAGTDSGVTYTSPDQVTVPRGVVTEFTDFPALVNGAIVPFATFTFTRY